MRQHYYFPWMQVAAKGQLRAFTCCFLFLFTFLVKHDSEKKKVFLHLFRVGICRVTLLFFHRFFFFFFEGRETSTSKKKKKTLAFALIKTHEQKTPISFFFFAGTVRGKQEKKKREGEYRRICCFQ